eukprot:14148280-Alexandrium_andersonii.AAC.1
MSASLVGAEMCIRDSLPPGWGCYYDPKTSAKYWHDTTSGRSQWEPPVAPPGGPALPATPAAPQAA